MDPKVDVKITPVDNVYVKLNCDIGILKEIQEQFSFEVPDAKHMPAVRSGKWDGIVRLVHGGRKTIYRGLTSKVIEFCEQCGYTVETDPSILDKEQFSLEDAKSFSASLNTPHQMRPYQLDAIVHCVTEKRGLLLSPTSSGKSLIIYNLVRYYSGRALIIVPTTSLCIQMKDDFKDYSVNNQFDVESKTSIIMQGRSKENLNEITIATWQSIYQLPKSFFAQFDVVVVDEAHHCTATSLKTILENSPCEHRFGFTGTTDGKEMNEMTLEGLFGPSKRVIDTATLIEEGYISSIDIRCIVFEYSKQSRKILSGEYKEELDFIVQHPERNNYICNLARALPGNTLILFQLLEKQGEIIRDRLIELGFDQSKLHYIAGATSAEERNEIRQKIDSSTGNILVASTGTTSTGVNIINLNNLILAAPTKSKIRTLQSIGRGLRKAGDKYHLTLFDLADDLSRGQSRNHTFRHFTERLKMYVSERFPYKIHKVKLESK